MGITVTFTMNEQDQRISDAVVREQARLRNFIRRRIANDADVEDVLQEVFYELIEAYRLMKPIEQLSAWMFRVARNRIIDRFRSKNVSASGELQSWGNDSPRLLDSLPSPDAGPDAAYARNLLLEEIEDALEELPEEQRAVFVAHEIEGQSFKEISQQTGLNLNTLLSRKHYAVTYLRRRLQSIYEEFRQGKTL
jgi:RNA polymerase sigma factor (sigma-70 family)